MKKKCEIVQDLLPMYVEGLTSPGSNKFIEEHTASCAECATYLDYLQTDLAIEHPSISLSEQEDQALVKDIKKRLQNRTFIFTFIGLLMGFFLALPFFPFTITGGVGLIMILGVIIYLMH